ncbi:MAG: TrkA family potassium uptake protein [Chloroflexi bacterium]|nr:TrkA family potassium uptake protein [Chloroflexota bacterium]
MYVIIVGGGKVGYYLCRTLLAEGHEVLIVEKNEAKCERLEEELGSICLRGDGCETATLAEAGTGRADMLIAATNEDEDNLVSCQLAKYKFKVRRTIALINNPENETVFKKLGIDVTVSSTNLVLEHIEQEVPTHHLMHLLKLEESGLEIVEVRIPGHSSVAGRRVRDLNLPQGAVLALVIRKDQRPMIPAPDTVLEAEDQVLAVTSHELEDALRLTLTGQRVERHGN